MTIVWLIYLSMQHKSKLNIRVISGACKNTFSSVWVWFSLETMKTIQKPNGGLHWLVHTLLSQTQGKLPIAFCQSRLNAKTNRKLYRSKYSNKERDIWFYKEYLLVFVFINLSSSAYPTLCKLYINTSHHYHIHSLWVLFRELQINACSWTIRRRWRVHRAKNVIGRSRDQSHNLLAVNILPPCTEKSNKSRNYTE